MNPPPDLPVEKEHQYHDYRTNQIPWYVRLLWLLFWGIAIVYVLRYLIPHLRVELFPGG